MKFWEDWQNGIMDFKKYVQIRIPAAYAMADIPAADQDYLMSKIFAQLLLQEALQFSSRSWCLQTKWASLSSLIPYSFLTNSILQVLQLDPLINFSKKYFKNIIFLFKAIPSIR